MKVFNSVITLVAIFVFLYLETTEASPKKCYYCKNNCKNPLEVVTCPSNGSYKCWSMKITNPRNHYSLVIKDCIKDSKPNRKICKGIDNCYTCETDLCNESINNN